MPQEIKVMYEGEQLTSVPNGRTLSLDCTAQTMQAPILIVNETYAQLDVTAITGSTVYITKGTDRIDATEVSGTWTFKITDLGTWTIHASVSGQSVTKNVAISSYTVYYENVGATLVVTAPTGSTVYAQKGSVRLDATEVSGTWTFAIPEFGTWTAYGSKGSEVASEQINISQLTLYTLELIPLPVKAFSALTWEEISRVCEAGKASNYIANGTWAIGNINTTVNYGGQTGGIQLVHCLTDEQRGSSYYNTTGHIICQFVNTIATSAYMQTSSSSTTSQIYFSGNLNSTCTSTYNGISSALKPYLKQWNCIVGKENTGQGSITGTYNRNVYMAVPTAKEVGGSNGYNATENNSTFTFTYYSSDTTNRRKKTGANANWWLRSPNAQGYVDPLWQTTSYDIGSTGGLGAATVYTVYGVAPIFVI